MSLDVYPKTFSSLSCHLDLVVGGAMCTVSQCRICLRRQEAGLRKVGRGRYKPQGGEFVRLYQFCPATHLCLYKRSTVYKVFVLGLQLSLCCDFPCLCDSTYRLCGLPVFVIKFEFSLGKAMIANIGSSKCGDEGLCTSKDGAIIASWGDMVSAMRRKEAEDMGSDPR